MTDKEELIKAAETLKQYCHERIGYLFADCKDCLFSDTCHEFLQYDSIGAIMGHFIDKMRCSDD